MTDRERAVQKVTWAEANGRGVRLTAEEEQALAVAAQEAESNALDAILDIPSVAHILDRVPKREERTRAGAVNRLEEAIESLVLVVASFDQIVGNLDQVGDVDLKLRKTLQLEQPREDFLGDVLRGLGRERPPGKAVHPVVVLFEEVQNDGGASFLR